MLDSVAAKAQREMSVSLTDTREEMSEKKARNWEIIARSVLFYLLSAGLTSA